MQAHLYTCSSCAKQAEVAFRVNVRKPKVISRATIDTPKPLCLRCAEQAQQKMLEEIKQKEEENKNKNKEKKQKTETDVETKNLETAISESKKYGKPEPRDGEVVLNWRWDAYRYIWSKNKPSIEGHYWVWTNETKEPILIHISDFSPNVSEILLKKDVWFLGPINIPPNPKDAEDQAANKRVQNKKIKSIETVINQRV
jgi:hypothetical protein